MGLILGGMLLHGVAGGRGAAVIVENSSLVKSDRESVDGLMGPRYFGREIRPILSGRVNFPFFLAPMVGLSHVALRMLVRRYLPKGAKTLWPTEMLNSRRLPSQALGDTPETLRHQSEDLLAPQILGNEKRPIQDSIGVLKDWGAVAIDINMGCPVAKALKHNYGVSLMGDPDYAAQVTAMAVESSDLPVSVKLRAGAQGDFAFLERFAKGLEAAGASWLFLHPRAPEQKRRGRADWSQIARLREKLRIPLIGNGDIQVLEDALQMLDQTQCDGVMIGRALTARPWLLWQIGHHFGLESPEGMKGDPPKGPEEEARAYGESLFYYLECLRQHFPENLGVKRFRFHIVVSHVWLNFGHSLFAQITKCQSYDDISSVLERFFGSSSLAMSERTDLRY